SRLADVSLGLERFATLAVEPLVGPLVDEAVVEDLLDELAAADVVACLTGLDEIVVTDVQSAPGRLELRRHFVAVRLRVLPEFSSTARHLDGVLVVAHEEEDLVSFHAPVAGLDVGAELLECGADVRPAVGIVDGGGQEITRSFGHGFRAPPEQASGP